MDVKSVKLVYFSPTGTSKKIAEAVARGTGAPYEHVDLTRPESRTREFARARGVGDLSLIHPWRPLSSGAVGDSARGLETDKSRSASSFIHDP